MYSTQLCMQRTLAHQSHLLAYIKQCERARHCMSGIVNIHRRRQGRLGAEASEVYG